MYHTTRNALGSQIKAMRRAKGLTASELARKVGVTENAIRKLEAGDSKEPRLSTALRLADALGAAPSLISVAGKDKHHAAGPELAAVISAVRAARNALTRIGIRHLRVFGSVARGTARNDSDIDVIVEPEHATTFTLFDLASVRETLERATDRRVDIMTEQTLKRSTFGLAADNEAVIVF